MLIWTCKLKMEKSLMTLDRPWKASAEIWVTVFIDFFILWGSIYRKNVELFTDPIFPFFIIQELKISWGLLRQCPNYILFSKWMKYRELCFFIFLYVMQKLIIFLEDRLYFLLLKCPKFECGLGYRAAMFQN